MSIFDNTLNAIEKALDLRLRRHSVLSGNVANSETPKYRAREFDFAGELQRVMAQNEPGSTDVKKTDKNHIDLSSTMGPHIIFDDAGAVGADGNNVDLDIQMGKLGENSRAYQAAVSYMQVKLRMLRTIARGRGGI